MEPSSPTNRGLPDGVEESDLVDGPKVVPLPSGRGTFLQDTNPTQGPPADTRFLNPQALAQPIGQMAVPGPHIPPPTDQGVNWRAPTVTTEIIKTDYAVLMKLALDILSARLLGVIALLAAVGIWGYVAISPEMWRIVAAGVFSVVVFLPVMAIYWKAGMTGEGG